MNYVPLSFVLEQFLTGGYLIVMFRRTPQLLILSSKFQKLLYVRKVPVPHWHAGKSEQKHVIIGCSYPALLTVFEFPGPITNEVALQQPGYRKRTHYTIMQR
jgi:hypothetical protein